MNEIADNASPAVHVRAPAFDERALPSFIIPHRMGYRWKHFNHRISVWKFGLARADNPGHPWADHLSAHTVGGPFTVGSVSGEHPRVTFGYQRVELDSTRRLGAARRQILVTLGPDGHYRGRHTFDRRAINLRGYSRVVPLITGFGFDTNIEQPKLYTPKYDPSHGYQTRGIGARVKVVDIDEESVTLEFALRFGFGSSMDRPNHNEALRDARVQAELDVALVGVNDVPIHTGEVGYDLEYDEPLIAVEQDIPSPPEDRTRVTLQGDPGASFGFTGMQSFNFELAPRRSCGWNAGWPMGDDLRAEAGRHPIYGPPGYYIRELALHLELESYDAETGEASFQFEGYASNSTRSVAFHAMRNNFSGRMAWVQADGSAGRHRLTRAFPTGSSRFSLLDFEAE